MGKILALTILALAISSASMIASAQDAITPSTKPSVHSKRERAPPKPAGPVIASASPAASCLPWYAIFFGAWTTSRHCACAFSSCSSPLVLGVGF
ncbi:MAG TPA: hypothetical protein VLJ17_22150 [Xanthobacteraceae bacterium]|nr:hypothetical protein [Xanthobacteraceae bacterium]